MYVFYIIRNKLGILKNDVLFYVIQGVIPYKIYFSACLIYKLHLIVTCYLGVYDEPTRLMLKLQTHLKDLLHTYLLNAWCISNNQILQFNSNISIDVNDFVIDKIDV